MTREQENEAGSAKTLLRLGINHLHGKEGYPRDEEKALILFRHVAAVASAMNSVQAAHLYYYIWVFGSHSAETFEWNKKAAELGHYDAYGIRCLCV